MILRYIISIAKRYHFDFEGVSQLMSDIDNMMNNCVKSGNIFKFHHKQPEIKKVYQITCEMVTHTFLNKNIYNTIPVKYEHQQRELSKRHQENLKFHLKRDLIHYLIPRNIYEDNYYNYEGTINSTNIFYPQQNNNSQFQNHGN
jgi:hypothetical protein